MLRQRIDDRLKVTKLVAGLERRLGRMIGVEKIEIGQHLEGDDLVAAGFVDQQVAGDLEQIGAAGGGLSDLAVGEGPRHRLGDDIVDIGALWKDSAQARPERALVGQYRRLEPIKPFSDRLYHNAPADRPRLSLDPIMTGR